MGSDPTPAARGFDENWKAQLFRKGDHAVLLRRRHGAWTAGDWFEANGRSHATGFELVSEQPKRGGARPDEGNPRQLERGCEGGILT
jgi:hypothetical protein